MKYYTVGTVEVFFPDDKICCMNCELLTSDNLNRPKCRKTGCLIYDTKTIHDYCPISFTGEIRGRKEHK